MDRAEQLTRPTGVAASKVLETRARLLEAARQIFERDGLTAARVAHISEAAGMSYGTFYHYFDSKEQAFREVAHEAVGQLVGALRAVVEDQSNQPVAEVVRRAIRAHFETYRDRAKIISVIDNTARQDPEIYLMWSGLLRAEEAAATRWIAVLQRQGLADASLNPRTAETAIGAMLWRFGEEWLVKHPGDWDFEETLDQVTHLVFNALGLRSGDAGIE